MTEQSIEIFLAVVRTGSISGAAQTLYITQPAVSRHIRALENEIGCTLFQRGKGIRKILLTEQGESFLSLAQRWLSLWRETKEISIHTVPRLNLSSVGSISSYILPNVIHRFISDYPEITFRFANHHSFEAYQNVENGTSDLALISDDIYYNGVETIPAFREPMVLITSNLCGLPVAPIHPTQLDPLQEIRLPWNPEYDVWHDFWFSPTAPARAVIDQMTLLEAFLSWGECWTIAPISVANALSIRCAACIHELQEGPSPRIIYYLKKPNSCLQSVSIFLSCLKQSILQLPDIECLL